MLFSVIAASNLQPASAGLYNLSAISLLSPFILHVNLRLTTIFNNL